MIIIATLETDEFVSHVFTDTVIICRCSGTNKRDLNWGGGDDVSHLRDVGICLGLESFNQDLKNVIENII